MTDLEIAQRAACAAMLKSGICESCPSFDSCVSRLAIDPHTLRLSGGVGARASRMKRDYRFALALFVGLLVSFLAVMVCSAQSFSYGDSDCTWERDGDQYIVTCTTVVPVPHPGTGNLPNDSVTNAFGSCTNCLQMTVEEMHAWKHDALFIVQDVSETARTVSSNASTIVEEVDILIHAPDGLMYYTGNLQGTAAANVARTNFVGIYISSISDTNLVKMAWSEALSKTTGSASTQPKSAYEVGCWNGALSYAQQASTSALSYRNTAVQIMDTLEGMQFGLDTLSANINALPETPCSGSGGGGSSGCDCENPDYNNWCTEEQGTSIITLLSTLKDYCNRANGILDNISALVEEHAKTLREGLWTEYTGIPKDLYSAAETNKSWKTFYLEAGDKGLDFGYQPTNILQRIELLLYGISGVAEDDKEAPIEVKDNDYSNSVSQVGLSFHQIADDSFLDDSKDSLDTFSTSLSGFFSSFSGMGNSSLSASDSFIASVTVNVGEEQFTMPAFGFGNEQSVGIANGFKETCRIFCTIVYLLGGALLFWQYWVWFASWALQFSKWATELIGSLFAS